jgi:acyl-coenzyme A synthetase/AMP-(fatty) acid ligase
MSARPPEPRNLRELIGANSGLRLEAPGSALRAPELLATTAVAGRRSDLYGKSVLISVAAQVDFARAVIELDGVAARLVIAPPDFSGERLQRATLQAKVQALIVDGLDHGGDLPSYVCGAPRPAPPDELRPLATQWVLPTSGTTGSPKLVAHSLASLLGGVSPTPAPVPVWATFYDIRRYGGLQVLLRACAAGAKLVLSDADEALGDFLSRCRAAGVTHISGTPSHWRRLLMSPDAHLLDPEYIRLSGEIADRAILEALRARYPEARIIHAYASTEAGVGFEVADGREGFPSTLLDGEGPVELRVRDGSLRIRSPRTAAHYVGRDDIALRDDEGFVDTDDIVEQSGERCYFRGRRAGVINIGGLKAHPEEIEEVINTHADVRMSRVSARRNPLMGDLVVAEVVLTDDGARRERAVLQDEIVRLCHERLARHKAPVTISFVPNLDLQASGKMARRHA